MIVSRSAWIVAAAVLTWVINDAWTGIRRSVLCVYEEILQNVCFLMGLYLIFIPEEERVITYQLLQCYLEDFCRYKAAYCKMIREIYGIQRLSELHFHLHYT